MKKVSMILIVVLSMAVGGGAVWATPHWFNLKGIQADIHHEYDKKVDNWAKEQKSNPYPLKQFKQKQARRMHEEIDAYYQSVLDQIQTKDQEQAKKEIKQKVDQYIKELKNFIDREFKENGFDVVK